MATAPILLLGGTGAIGTLTARALRATYPEQPLLIGGRDLAKAQTAARALGHAEGIIIDTTAEDLGIEGECVSAVAVFYADARLASLSFAHARGIPHLGISSGIFEIAPEVATFMQKPDSAAVVLGYEWLVGATSVATLAAAAQFSRVDDITIGALVDEQDAGGPAVEEDFERLSRMMPRALTRRNGEWIWREGDDTKATVCAIDGTRIDGSGFSSIDITGLAAKSGAANVRFDIATGISSSRRAGKAMSTEIVIQLEGQGLDGVPLKTRHAVFHPAGAAPLTAIGVSMILERLLGLDGAAPTPAGLFFPYQVLDSSAYLGRLRSDGGDLVALDPL